VRALHRVAQAAVPGPQRRQARIRGVHVEAKPGALATGPGWKLELELNGFFGLDEGAQFAPTASVDRGPLHLEARYNYEDFHTATFFAGWGFRWGGDETFLRAVPLLGGAVGESAGLVPGLEVEAQWWRLSYWLELEYLFDLKHGS